MGAYEFQPSDFVNLGMDTTVCIGSSLTLDAQNIGTTYEWSDGSTDQTLIVTSAGTYSVIVTDDNGCVGSDTVNITEEDCASLEDWSQNQLSVFPNPSTTGIFKVIAAQTFSGESIIVLNALGQEIATYTFTGTEVVVDLSKEESGLYLLKTNTQTFKLIKQ